ncbi:hypothetical protein ACOSQ3_004450 [Xanthoceras sorbifolium]
MESTSSLNTGVSSVSTVQASSFPQHLNFHLPLKLDENNYVLWKSQVLPAVRAFDLEEFILGERLCPSKFLDITSVVSGNTEKQVNPEFLQSIADCLVAAGQQVSDRDLLMNILEGLGSEFDAVVVNITSLQSSISVREAQFFLMSYEARMNQQASSASLAISGASANYSQSNFQRGGTQHQQNMRGRRSRGRGRGGGRFGGRSVCQLCRRSGHYSAICFHRFDQNFQGNRPPYGQQQQGSPAQNYSGGFNGGYTSAASQNDSNWYIDSGATNHVTPDVGNLTLKSDYRGKEHLARTSTQSTMKELLQLHNLYEKNSHTVFLLTCVYTLALSQCFHLRNRIPGLLIGVIAPDLPEPHTWAPHRGYPPDLPEPHLGSSSGSSPRISRNRTWAPHRGHRPGSPGTAHLGSSSGSPPGSPGTAPGLLIGVIAPDLPEPHTWAPHRGHPPDLPEPHLGSSSGSSPRISRNRTWAPHRVYNISHACERIEQNREKCSSWSIEVRGKIYSHN